jgi:RNA polymerase sigma-70 factor (ECF subfamily)
LPEIYRNPITLIDLHELDYSEAAEVLEIPLGTLKSRLARARFQMKEKLQRTFEFSGSITPSNVRLAV